MAGATFHRRIVLGFILVLICAGVIAGASILSLRSIRSGSEQLAKTYAHQLIMVERLESANGRKAEAARGLLMSNDEIFAHRLQRASLESQQLVAELRKAIQSPEGQQALDTIEKAAKEYQDDLDAAIALRRSGASMDAVTQHWRMNAAVRRDEVAADIHQLRTRKEVLLEDAEAAQFRSSGRLTWFIVAMTVVSLLLAGLLAFIITRTLVRMYDAETLAREGAEEARQWFATTLSSIGDGVIATDTKGNVTFLNGIAEQLTGWERADALGKPLEDVFAIRNEKTGEPQENPVKQVLRTGVAVQLANSTVLVARDGQRRPVDDSAAPIRDAKRDVAGVVLVFRDVSERRRAEAAIRESREWLATTVRSIGDAVIATDSNGRITLLNPIAQKLTGWTEQQAIGAPLESVFNIINEQTRKRAASPAEKVLATGQVVGLANHTVLVAKDGTEWPLDDSGAPIRDAQGYIIGVVLVFREVTERRRAEEVLRRLSAIVESSDDAIIGKTLDGVITSWNAGAQNLYGYSAEEVVGHPVSLLVPENQVDEMPEILTRLARGERIDHFETVRRRKDGRLVDVFLNVSPILDQAGGVIGAATIARDITTRNKTAEALRQSEARFRSIYEQAAVGIEQVGMDGRLLMVNGALCALLGYSEAELLARSFEDITYPDDLDRERKLLAQMVSGAVASYEIEKRYVTRAGARVWIHVTSSVVKDSAGHPAYRISVLQNIAERKRLEQEVKRAKDVAESRLTELQSIIQHMTEGVVVLDAEGKLLLANRAFLRLFDLESEEQYRLYAYQYPELLLAYEPNGRLVPYNEWPVVRAMQGETILGSELRVRCAHSGKEVIVSHNAAPIRDENGKVIMAVLTLDDVTERKRAEEALIRSEKLASAGRLAATMAHEINNPLEAVVNSLYLATRDSSLSPETRSHLQIAEEQLGRVTQLTKQTLGFYREGRTRTVVKLPQLLQDVLAFYRAKLLEKNITVYTRFDIQNGFVPGTMGELRQVASNLITNSLDALPSGGKLHVRVRRCAFSNGIPAVCLTIADNGYGIAREHVGRIFEPFFTTKQAVGTGLGLWIAKEIVSRHGGHIAVHTRSGKGTVFCIYLPATDERRPASASAATACT